jgi:predicted dithiol-disulfide oxidoreductase (DUF899 family)
MESHKVVSHDEWIDTRTQFLAREKEFTRLRDQLSQERRDLPWEPVDKNYTFHGPAGKETLSDLFAGRGQLIVYHFMFGSDWEAGCPSCSLFADGFNGIIVHLNQRDVTFVAASRAPFSKLDAYRKRMGWSFKWVSSAANDFNRDYHVSFTPEDLASGEAYYNYTKQKLWGEEMPGASVFYKDPGGKVFHTYSAYGRGLDMLMLNYQFLDLVPKGRDEADQKPHPQAWVRRHDEYGNDAGQSRA